jgi:hypothetical protein
MTDSTAILLDHQPNSAARQAGSAGRRPAGGEPVGRYRVPNLEELHEHMQARIESVSEKLGFVPNVF